MASTSDATTCADTSETPRKTSLDPSPTTGTPGDPAKIVEGLYLGSKLAASSLETLRHHGITHVLNTAAEIPNYHEGGDPPKLSYLRLNLHDIASDDIGAQFEPCSKWIREAIDSGGAVFVHCQAGISRSATIVIGYLMMEQDMTLREALLLTKERRHNVGPNECFFDALIGLEDSLRDASSRGEPPSFSMSEYYAESLVNMGFDGDIAKDAIKRAGGRFELALNFCLSGV